MMDITAAVARSGKDPFNIEKLQLDGPRPDELLVKIAAVGICHTDLVFKDGLAGEPTVLGHEGSGVIEAVGGAVTDFKPGDRVALTFRSCGKCARCSRGQPAYCGNFSALNFSGRRTDGSKALRNGPEEISSNFFGQSSFASHALAYERNVVKLPDDLPLEIAAPLGCGVQTGTGAIMNSLACPIGSSLLVSGGGSVGLSAVLGGAIQGCSEIFLVEPQAERRKLALTLGATHAIDPVSENVAEVVRAIKPEGVDFAFDTTGHTETLKAAIELLAIRGVLGVVAAGGPFGIDSTQVVMGGRTIRGIIEGDSQPKSFIPLLIELHRRGRFPFDKLIRTYPFAQIANAIRDQAAGICVKAVLTF